jgi:hypothetical protein
MHRNCFGIVKRLRFRGNAPNMRGIAFEQGGTPGALDERFLAMPAKALTDGCDGEYAEMAKTVMVRAKMWAITKTSVWTDRAESRHLHAVKPRWLSPN